MVLVRTFEELLDRREIDPTPWSISRPIGGRSRRRRIGEVHRSLPPEALQATAPAGQRDSRNRNRKCDNQTIFAETHHSGIPAGLLAALRGSARARGVSYDELFDGDVGAGGACLDRQIRSQ